MKIKEKLIETQDRQDKYSIAEKCGRGILDNDKERTKVNRMSAVMAFVTCVVIAIASAAMMIASSGGYMATLPYSVSVVLFCGIPILALAILLFVVAVVMS